MYDRRHHRSLADDDILEYITSLRGEEVAWLNGLLLEAEEFADEDLKTFCRRFMRLKTSVGGKRAEKIAEVAIHDEAAAVTHQENVVPPRPPV